MESVFYTYKTYGNITNKSDIGNFTYAEETAGPHALTSAGNNFSVIPEIPQLINYTSFNKIEDIQEGAYKQYFFYGPEQNRKRTILDQDVTTIKEKFYVGNYEKEVLPDKTREIHYISTGDGVSAIYVIENGTGTMYYVYKDHLGSPYCITYENGDVAEYLSFDAWGRRRNFDKHFGSQLPDYYKGSSNHFDIRYFEKGDTWLGSGYSRNKVMGWAPYQNPRTNNWHQESYYSKANFSIGDVFIQILGLSPLSLLLLL